MPQRLIPAYVVAAAKPWNRRVFQERIRRYPGRWYFLDRPGQLTLRRLAAMSPRYVFFLHWSWKVPEAITNRYECIGFHMTDLPYGRGGSPLQHLILAGHRTTMLTALRLNGRLDAGPMYVKAPLDLRGTAQDIYIRASRLAARIIRRLIARPVTPAPQAGRATVWRRRTPDQSRIPAAASPARLYDFIRMLDADGYPRAFLEQGAFRYEFSRAALKGRQVQARVRIVPKRAP